MTAHAALYIQANNAIDLRGLQEIIENAALPLNMKRRTNGHVEQITMADSDLHITINFMDSERIPEHIRGFLGWVDFVERAISSRDSKAANSSADFFKLKKQIANTRYVLGVIIQPGMDSAGKCKQFILDLAAHHDALIFAYDSVYDGAGRVIIGKKDAPDYYG